MSMSSHRLQTRPVFVVIAVVVVAALLTAAALRIAQINTRFPNPTVVEHQLGETFMVEGVEFRITDVCLIGYAEMKKTVPSYEIEFLDEQQNPFEPSRLRFLLVGMDVRRVSQGSPSFSLTWSYVQSRAWRNGFDHNLFRNLNEGKEVSSALDGSETARLVLPYTMTDTQFKSQADWETVEDRPFDLIVSTYPVENIVHVLSERNQEGSS
jgi:hypothetical protein